MTKLKTGAITLVVTLILAGLFGEMFFRSPIARHTGKDEETVTIKVIFDPPYREGRTRPTVQVMALGASVVKPKLLSNSPWVQLAQVGKGVNVTVLGSQSYGLTLRCEIWQKEKLQAHDDADGPGAVQCDYKIGT
jgi:hypothetical protein